MIRFERVQKAVLTSEESCQYLALDSERSLERLVSAGRLTPLRIAKANLFARAELDDFVQRELDRERRLRGASDSASDGNSHGTN